MTIPYPRTYYPLREMSHESCTWLPSEINMVATANIANISLGITSTNAIGYKKKYERDYSTCIEPPRPIHSKSSNKNAHKDTTALLSSSSNISNLSVNLDSMTVTNNNQNHNEKENYHNAYLETNSSLEFTNTQLSSTIRITADSSQRSAHYNNHNNEMNDKLTIVNSENSGQEQHATVVIPINERVPTKSIRIERDYTLGDGITRFHTTYPTELNGKMSLTNGRYAESS
ncbi:hypothetical protein BDF20DRAFT_832284 [Mycotypha africana]|uniref:uncharacterized protein n=1 Tax=Mycotypha africana TaxID=64632 RepID=UPI0023003385|nr:uncharacterized protein BDF20DRAFT_832284 [Mycotypha africana]KAI8987340.1 hypothetical protein BDF20DRAFT_832284 [Mycotypha africana]